MADNLLPCPNPWCDSGVQPMSFAMRGGFHQVICGCDFKGPRKATKEEAEAAWNRRPAPMEAVAWGYAYRRLSFEDGIPLEDAPWNLTMYDDGFLMMLKADPEHWEVQALAVIPTQEGGE